MKEVEYVQEIANMKKEITKLEQSLRRYRKMVLEANRKT